MFRKLYWVTESVDAKGLSHVVGVYTSIPDLIRHGLSTNDRNSRLRLTLTKLDSDRTPFGTWCEPHFEGLDDKLQEFVVTEEFLPEQCEMLVDALKRRPAIAA